MWICHNEAFLSIVHKDCGPDHLMVRARVRGHIQKVFPKAKVSQTLGNDYQFRAVVSRIDVANALAEMAFDVDYPNFKDSVRDDKLHGAYNRVWSAMSSLQEYAPYSRVKRGNGPKRVSAYWPDDDLFERAST